MMGPHKVIKHLKINCSKGEGGGSVVVFVLDDHLCCEDALLLWWWLLLWLAGRSR